MSKRKKILNLLKKNDLTSKEIQERTGYDINLIWTYLSQYKKENKIEKVGDKGNFPIYRAVKQENNGQNPLDTQILKKLIVPFAKHNIEVDLEEQEINRIKELMEMIK